MVTVASSPAIRLQFILEHNNTALPMISSSAAAADAAARCLPRNSNVLGSFWPGCFQSSLARASGADPLPLALLDPLGLPCVLHIALYGDEFEPLTPLALLQLPNAPAFLRACLAQSPALLEALATHLADSSVQPSSADLLSDSPSTARPALEFFVSILGAPMRGPCQHFQCDATDELNLVAHAWRFQGAVSMVPYRAIVFSDVSSPLLVPYPRNS